MQGRQAAWQWAGEVAGFLADTRARSYCVQYGESDYAPKEVPLGDGNTFDADDHTKPWRPQLEDRTGARINPRPTAPAR